MIMTLPNRTNYSVEGNRKDPADSNSNHNKSLDPLASAATAYLAAPPSSAPTFSSFQTPSGLLDVNQIKQQPDIKSDHTVPSLPLVPSNNGSGNAYDAYRNTGVERLSMEDIQEKKNFVLKHRLQSSMLRIVEYCRSEGIIPSLPPSLYTPVQRPSDYSLNEFLEAQGIEFPEDDQVTTEDGEFTCKLVALKNAYTDELEKLNRVCNEFIAKLTAVLTEQGRLRLVTQQEVAAKSMAIQQKFDFVRNQLRSNVCSAISLLQKQYNHLSKKRRRSLTKHATEILSKWFKDNISDPYPSDEQKSMLATQCVLSLTQVNNWFGNKRIRFKKKEQERAMPDANHAANASKVDPNAGNVMMLGTAAGGAPFGAFQHHQHLQQLQQHQLQQSSGGDSPDGLGSPNESGDGDDSYSASPPLKVAKMF